MAIRRNIIENAIDVSKFTFHDNCFSTEASDLGPVNLMTIIYDDTIDVGISLYNPKSKNTVIYYLKTTKVDNDNDIKYWEYSPISEHVRKYPAIAGTRVLIFND